MSTYGSYTKTMTLTQGGTLTDLDSTTGLQRRKLTSTTAKDIITMASLLVETEDGAAAGTGAAKLYVKNIGNGKGVIDKSIYVSISLGTVGGTIQEISKLYGGDWLLIPVTGIDATSDIVATPETNDGVVLEFALYYQED
mgnify:CR=1 FL=1